MNKNNGKKVYVGISGGVDSSLSAAFLKEQGYDVTGVFIKVWQPDFVECTWKEDRLDAMRVASQLDIPFVTLDLEKEYKEGVIDYMIDEYKNGRTPNPDVMCNRQVKFGAFWKWAKAQGADYVATGHYVITDGKNLIVSKDKNKDQSYFLWTLTQHDLEHILFPIGHMKKDDVRKESDKRNLYTSAKKDSQGLCFVGSIDMKTFLKTQIEMRIGEVVNEEGKVIGTHDGMMFYTIGERHHFNITEKGTDEKPYFVSEKNIEKNQLVVSHIKPEIEHSEKIILENVSFVNEEPKEDEVYEARARYRAPLAKIKLKKEKSEWVAEVIEGEMVVASGQSLVIYKNEICMGGGIIV